MPQVIPRDLGDFASFVTIDSGLRGLYIAGCSRLNLNKTKDIVVPSDEVDFATVAGSTVVSGDNEVAEFPQMEVGVFLPPAAGSLVLWFLVTGEGVRCDPIETADDSAGKDGWNHAAARVWQ